MITSQRFLSCVAGSLSVCLLSVGGAIAQTYSSAPTEAEQALRDTQQTTGGAFSVGGSNVNLMQLMHNANLGSRISADRFREQQAESLSESAEAYRAGRQTQIQLKFEPTQKPVTPKP